MDPTRPTPHACTTASQIPLSTSPTVDFLLLQSALATMVKQITSVEEWEALTSAESGKTVVVDFTASWCGPCKMIGPIFAQLAESLATDGVEFIKVDVDELAAVAEACGISAMPTFQVWKNGAKVEEMVGANKDKLQQFIEKYTNKE